MLSDGLASVDQELADWLPANVGVDEGFRLVGDPICDKQMILNSIASISKLSDLPPVKG